MQDFRDAEDVRVVRDGRGVSEVRDVRAVTAGRALSAVKEVSPAAGKLFKII